MRRFVSGLGAALVVALAVSGVAGADGGTSIANAPELPLGTQVAGAVARLDHWRLTIRTGDTLTIDYEPIATRSIVLCLENPDVTDFTISQVRCDTADADRKSRWIRDFSTPGRYTLVLGTDGCIRVHYGSQTPDTKCADPMAYELTAYVVHRTSMSLDPVPRLVRKGSRTDVRGTVRGLESGNILLQEKVAGRWTNRGVVAVSSGRFHTKITAGVAGSPRFRISYPGDASHKPSSTRFGFVVA